MAGISQRHRDSEGSPSSNMTSLSAGANVPASFADTSVRLPAGHEGWPRAIADFKTLLQTIRASIDPSHSPESSSTDVSAKREDLTRLVDHLQPIEGSVAHFEWLVLNLLDPTRPAARNTPSGNVWSLQHAGPHVVDEWSHYSPGSGSLDEPVETLKIVDQAELARTLENLIETCAEVAIQLEGRDDHNGAHELRDQVIPFFREALLRSQREPPPQRFSGIDMQSLDALREA